LEQQAAQVLQTGSEAIHHQAKKSLLKVVNLEKDFLQMGFNAAQ